MSFLRRRYSGDGNYAPRSPVIIDPGNGLARGLQWAVPLFSGDNIDIVGKIRPTITSTPTIISSEIVNNKALQFNGTDGIDYGVTHFLDGATKFSVSCIFRLNAEANLDSIVIQEGTTAGNTPLISRITTSETITFLRQFTGITSSTVLTLGKWNWFVGVNDGDKMFIYLDGIIDTTGASATGGVTGTATTAKLSIAKSQPADNRPGEIDVAEALIWDRALTPNEVWALYEPSTRWDLYWQPRPMVSVLAIAAVVGGSVNPKPWNRSMLGGVGRLL